MLQNRLKAKPGHPGIQVIRDYGNLPPVVSRWTDESGVYESVDKCDRMFWKKGLGVRKNQGSRESGAGENSSPLHPFPYPLPLVPHTQCPIPTIRIRTLIQEDYVIISIADNGQA